MLRRRRSRTLRCKRALRHAHETLRLAPAALEQITPDQSDPGRGTSAVVTAGAGIARDDATAAAAASVAFASLGTKWGHQAGAPSGGVRVQPGGARCTNSENCSRTPILFSLLGEERLSGQSCRIGPVLGLHSCRSRNCGLWSPGDRHGWTLQV